MLYASEMIEPIILPAIPRRLGLAHTDLGQEKHGSSAGAGHVVDSAFLFCDLYGPNLRPHRLAVWEQSWLEVRHKHIIPFQSCTIVR